MEYLGPHTEGSQKVSRMQDIFGLLGQVLMLFGHNYSQPTAQVSQGWNSGYIPLMCLGV